MYHEVWTRKRMMRLTALGVVLGIVGIASLLIDWRLRTERPAALSLNGSPSVGEERKITNPNPLAAYPAPETFKHFAYDGKTLSSGNYFEISGTCADTYYTVLLFPKAFDYRDDPTRAIVNRATLCPPEKNFVLKIYPKEVGGLMAGEYYAIVADQGASGLWYNPK